MRRAATRTAEETRAEPLERAVDHVIHEARMVLPGIQALFGFQLIAVFNDRFHTALEPYQRFMHLGALLLVAFAIALIMTPAAYHRQAEEGRITWHFVKLASTLLTSAMVPLMLGIVLEVLLVSEMVVKDERISIAIAALTFVLFAALWFVYPRISRRRRAGDERREAP
jgi:hypothetical protein